MIISIVNSTFGVKISFELSPEYDRIVNWVMLLRVVSFDRLMLSRVYNIDVIKQDRGYHSIR